MKIKANQHLDILITDEELKQLRANVPLDYIPDMAHWSRERQKEFYLGFIQGINAVMRVGKSKMNVKDKEDYITKLTIDAALFADGWGKIIE